MYRLYKMKKIRFERDNMRSIPIMVDDVKNYINFNMTRCSYFSIECDLPSSGWILELKKRDIPFYLISLSGVIEGPVGDNYIFNSSELIEELFDIVEEIPELFIDVNDIWLPNLLFKYSLLKRG